MHKGTKIKCWNCGKQLYKLKRDIGVKDPLNPKDLQALKDTPKPYLGMPMVCPHCKAPLYQSFTNALVKRS